MKICVGVLSGSTEALKLKLFSLFCRLKCRKFSVITFKFPEIFQSSASFHPPLSSLQTTSSCLKLAVKIRGLKRDNWILLCWLYLFTSPCDLECEEERERIKIKGREERKHTAALINWRKTFVGAEHNFNFHIRAFEKVFFFISKLTVRIHPSSHIHLFSCKIFVLLQNSLA